MKKIISILLLFLYLVPVIGINASVHYCGGKISSVSVGLEKTTKCTCGSKKMKKDCCKDKKISFKLTDNQQKTQVLTLNFFKIVDFQPSIIPDYTFLNPPVFVQKGFYNTLHPPENVKPPIYILNQVFII